MKAFVYQEHFSYDGEPRIEWHSPRTPGRAYGLWLFSVRLPFKLRFVAQGGKRKSQTTGSHYYTITALDSHGNPTDAGVDWK